MTTDISDDDLVRMYAEGDESAFDMLFGRYCAAVYNFACVMIHDSHKAEEILQETFLAVIRALPAYTPQGKFKNWLLRIARNRCLNRIEAERSARVVADDTVLDALSPASALPSPSDRAQAHEREARIRRAVAGLPDRQREAIALYAFEQMRYEDIARTLEVPVNTVKTLIHRGRATLAQELELMRKE